MDKPLIDTLAERVERLEQECSRLKWANQRTKRLGFLASIIVVVLIVGGAKFAAVPDAAVIQAERFILRDKEGKIRADLATSPDGPTVRSCSGWFSGKGEVGRTEG